MKNLVLISIALFIVSCSRHSSVEVFEDYSKGLSYASKENQNILLVFDFLGNPNNCAKKLIYDKDFEEVLEEITVVLLNVDDPSLEGNANRKFQIDKFGTNTQPMYYLLSKEGKVIRDPIGYCTKSEFKDFINN